MSLGAPVSYHLDLYRYWCEKRGNRAMPARSDIEAGDICALLPYLTILDKVDGEFRYRFFSPASLSCVRAAGIIRAELTAHVLADDLTSTSDTLRHHR